MAYYDRDYYAEQPSRTVWSPRFEPVCRLLAIVLACVYIACGFVASDIIRAGASGGFHTWVGALVSQPNALLPVDGPWPWPGAWQLMTASFIHANLVELVLVVVMLWLIGGLVESRMGTQRFLLFVLSVVLLSNVAAALIDPFIAPQAVSMGFGPVTVALILATIYYSPAAITFFGIHFRVFGWIIVIVTGVFSLSSYFDGFGPTEVRIIQSLPALVVAALWGHLKLLECSNDTV